MQILVTIVHAFSNGGVEFHVFPSTFDVVLITVWSSHHTQRCDILSLYRRICHAIVSDGDGLSSRQNGSRITQSDSDVTLVDCVRQCEYRDRSLKHARGSLDVFADKFSSAFHETLQNCGLLLWKEYIQFWSIGSHYGFCFNTGLFCERL